MDTCKVNLLRNKIDIAKILGMDTEDVKNRAAKIEAFEGLSIMSEKNKPNKFSASEHLGIQDALISAAKCYCLSLHDACIIFASIAVECVLNWDSRLQTVRKSKSKELGWLRINNRNLLCVHYKGLPVEALLYPDETINALEPKCAPIKFVFLRNKHAHGDYSGLDVIHYAVEDGDEIPVYRQPSPSDALEQLNRSINFVMKWAGSKPEVARRLE